jgi:hypothetical protein
VNTCEEASFSPIHKSWIADFLFFSVLRYEVI